ncbi:SMC-Scp complex subunit ScpB [Conexibacter woesei]|uniref:SMC-Scp complex subunit ScpB n=1 Tax=Conexibacter woesei TaxID=191495 RepID=UPI000402D5DF|nr:SMC-Scp complex subunit ScpB [Conexibacter woesei]
MSDLARNLEALLFLSTDPVNEVELIAACECTEDDFAEALEELKAAFAPGARGLELRELAGGWTLATAADTEQAARRLLSRPRTPPLSPAQAETLAIIAYLQPVSRPEITRIRGVSADSAAGTLLERGLIEESGRSPFGAVLYRTTPLFLKLFGMVTLDDLPEVEEWDPTPEEEADLRERLLRAGEARAGSSPTTQQMEDDAIEGAAADPAAEGLTPEADAEAEAAESEVLAAAEDVTVGEGTPPEEVAGEDEEAADAETAAEGEDALDPFEAPFVERIPAEEVAEATEPPSDDED